MPHESYDFGGLAVRVRGLPEHQRVRFRQAWRAFETSSQGPWFLDVEAVVAPEIDDPAPFGAKAMTARFDGGTAVYAMAEGSAEVAQAGVVHVQLASTSAPKQFFALLNLLCAAVAWRLPSRTGAVLHAGGIVLDGRAFVLIGPEGSGKTTFALRAKEAGAGVLSDDIIVVDRAATGGFDAVSSPFRSEQHGNLPRGRWPLAALLLPDHGSPPRLASVPSMAVRARLCANLPFVVEAFGTDGRLAEVVEALVSSVPARTLTFPPDSSFVPPLRGFAAGHSGRD